MNKHLPVFLVLLTLFSCDISRNRGSEMYLPGPAIRDGYSPMGLVEELQYSGSVPGPTHRRMIVYLPPDYYRTERRFPVLYLLHGARGYETSWIRKGHVYQSTDSLWREGLAEPCIVVMPNVKIGDGAVIGGNTWVTSSVAPGETVTLSGQKRKKNT